MNKVRKASFIHTEEGKDLIVSFALAGETDPAVVESLTLMRTPMFESFALPEERGVNISLECDDDNDMVEHFEFRDADHQVLIRSRQRQFTVDVSDVDKSEISEMGKIIREMCSDNAFTIRGLEPDE